MQRHTPVHLKEGRIHTESNRSVKRKAPPPSLSKKHKSKASPFNFDKFMHKLKIENINTERFVSPSRTLQQIFDVDRRNNSSKSRSRNLTQSIGTSRQRSGDTYRRTLKQKDKRSKSRGLNPIVAECLRVLQVPKRLPFCELATQFFNRFGEVQSKLKRATKEDYERIQAAHALSVRYRQIFAVLIKSMIGELTSLSDQKECEILNSVESIASLQSSILQKQNEVFDLQDKIDKLQDELTSTQRISRQQNSYIIEMVKKESKVSKLLYAVRRRGIDIDRIYTEDVQSPINDSGVTEEDQESSEQPQSIVGPQDPNNQYSQGHLNQSY